MFYLVCLGRLPVFAIGGYLSAALYMRVAWRWMQRRAASYDGD